MTASECRSFIRALFCYGPKMGVPVTLVVPYESEIHRQMWSRPGKIIVGCGNDINEVIQVKAISKIEINPISLDCDYIKEKENSRGELQ